jgi:hypothetical protein
MIEKMEIIDTQKTKIKNMNDLSFSQFHNIKESTSKLGPVYHGGSWDGSKQIKTNGRGALGQGAYFTPDIKIAEQYAKESGLPYVVEAFLHIMNPLVIHTNTGEMSHPCVDAFVQLGIDKDKAVAMVEKIEDQYGYVGKQISSRAVPQGYDGILQYFNNRLREIVVWNAIQVQQTKTINTYG